MDFKRLVLSILLLAGMAGRVSAAELLVRAQGHWMDELTQVEVDKMTPETKQSYEARTQDDDIVVVRPDGWAWGKEECLPRYRIRKVPDMTESEAKHLEEPLVETVIDKDGKQTQKLLRFRKYALPAKDSIDATTETTSLTKASLISTVIVKTGAASEVSAPKTGVIAFYLRKVAPYLAVARTFWVENAYAATQLLKTVKPSDGDYTSLEACMNANEQNLVTADKYFDVEIDGTWSSADTTAVVVHNYTTDATRYINIYTTATARHKGVYSTNYYLLYPSTNSMALYVDNNNDESKITIKGLQVDGRNKTGTGGEGSGGCIHIEVYDANSTIAYNLVRSTAYSGIDVESGRGSYTRVYNNIVYSSANTAYANGICTYTSNGSYIANNTIYGFYRQIYRGEAGVLKNNLSMNGGNVAIYGTGATGSNNATYDSTGDDGSLTAGMVGYTSYSDYFVSVTAGSEDFHLKAGSPFIDQGADISGDSAGVTDDIDGVTRSGTWDIGADEYVAAGGGIPVTFANSRENFNNGFAIFD